MTTNSDPAAKRQEFTVHECDVCGYIEGESPQAGCCPKCGSSASTPVPVKVRRV